MKKKSTACTTEELHTEHICELESAQDWQTLATVTADPKFQCQNCGARAHRAANVCMPEEL